MASTAVQIRNLVDGCKVYLAEGSLPERDGKPEQQTQNLLVDPLLETLGWERSYETPAYYVKEYGIGEKHKKWTDYALFFDGVPRV